MTLRTTGEGGAVAVGESNAPARHGPIVVGVILPQLLNSGLTPDKLQQICVHTFFGQDSSNARTSRKM